MNARPKRLMPVFLAIIAAMPWVSVAGAEQAASQPTRQLVAAEGKGYLELVNGYRVLHLKGSPEEMGRQHGALLKDSIAAVCKGMLERDAGKTLKVGGMEVPQSALAAMLRAAFADKIPPQYLAEIKAIARASGVDEQTLITSNLLPEMFHCSGFALLNEATAQGKLYHGRILDYGVKMGLQNHAVLIIQEPAGKIPFVNVGYAGGIGSVTGMNLKGIGVGEMGGGGQGLWNGIPMNMLIRMVLEDARSLDEAVAIFRDNPRTCEYYYVISDANKNDAVGMRAVPESLEIVKPGEMNARLPMPVPNTVIMSAGQRYLNLSNRIREGLGSFTEESAIRLMDAPVAMKNNLHNALMIPGDSIIHVANAAADGSPAWQQNYYRFDIKELMSTPPSVKAK